MHDQTGKMEHACPCGSGKTYEECCKVFLDGAAWPSDPEQMVRARYSAYVVHNWQFLVDTHLPSEENPALTVDELEERAGDIEWHGLNIVGSGVCGDDEEEERGNPYVDFYAYYYLGNSMRQIGEHSYFTTRDDKLYYTYGVELTPEPIRNEHPKIGRNDPCPCGSGKKYKKCCGKNA